MTAPDRSSNRSEEWLQRASLSELQEAYPREWEVVQRELAKVTSSGDLNDVKAYARTVASPSAPGRRAPGRRGRDDARSEQIRRRMAAAALKQLALSAATGVHEGRVRFNLVNGYVAQKLLFVRDLERKPVSLFWFRLVWPVLWQRRLLMPLVARKGIYCFYSKPLINALAELIGDRSCLEIAAGDGTLTRFLAAQGVDVVATDDHSWADVTFPPEVRRMDAAKALRAHDPEVVICSWPPAGNGFEQRVFETPSVQLYILITSRHRFASGNWDAYERQTGFEWAEDPALSRLVLPPELDAGVFVFRRKVA